jgi:hypothetical protein
MTGWIHRFLAAIGVGGYKTEADVSYDPVLENHAAGDTPGTKAADRNETTDRIPRG